MHLNFHLSPLICANQCYQWDVHQNHVSKRILRIRCLYAKRWHLLCWNAIPLCFLVLNVVIFRANARHIVIRITSINSSTRRVHLNNNTIFNGMKMLCPHQCVCTFESKENSSEMVICVLHVSFSLSFLSLSFRSLWIALPRNSNVCIHILNAHCFQWGLFISVCFMLFSCLHWARKRVCFAPIVFQWISNQ